MREVASFYGQRTRYRKLGQLPAWLHQRKHELLKVREPPWPSPSPMSSCAGSILTASRPILLTIPARRYSDFPLLVTLTERDGHLVPDRMLWAAENGLGETNNPDQKAVGIDETTGDLVVPHGSAGHRWGEKGKWNLEEEDGQGRDIRLRMSLAEAHDAIAPVALPYFGGQVSHGWVPTRHGSILTRNVPVREVALAKGGRGRVAPSSTCIARTMP